MLCSIQAWLGVIKLPEAPNWIQDSVERVVLKNINHNH
jgi:hypothetical protein